MTYGLDSGLFVENGPAIHASNAFVRGRSWRTLEPERRLQMIEKALKTPSNDFSDGFPIAL